MERMDYWHRQGKKALFSEVDIEKPERKQLAGRLLLIGGSGTSFFAVAGAAAKAMAMGVGEVKVLLPDSLKKQVPMGPDIIFAPSEVSGGFSKGAVGLATAAAENADIVLMIGDMGKNAETVAFAERFVAECTKPIVVTRDATELLMGSASDWLGREDMSLCVTLSQLQKILRAIYYPKVITLTMPVNQLVEILHKFTISYPVMVLTYHSGQVVAAKDGRVVTTELKGTGFTPISLWSGEWAVKITALRLWNPGRDFAAAAVAILA